MLRHQLGQNLVLRLDLLLQVVDPFLLGGMVRPRFRLKGSRVLVQREMESWRAPLASISPIAPGQLAPANWFQKGDQVGWSHSPQGALGTGPSACVTRASRLRSSRA